jgi:hypothetical protein
MTARLPSDYSVGKIEFSMNHYRRNKDKAYIRGMSWYDRYDTLMGEINGTEKEDSKHTLELLPHEKVVSVRVTTYAHLPCELSFYMVTSAPKEAPAHYEENEEEEEKETVFEIPETVAETEAGREYAMKMKRMATLTPNNDHSKGLFSKLSK